MKNGEGELVKCKNTASNCTWTHKPISDMTKAEAKKEVLATNLRGMDAVARRIDKAPDGLFKSE